MAEIKITELPAAGTLDPALDALPIVNSGTTSKTTAHDILSAGLQALGVGYVNSNGTDIVAILPIPNTDIGGLGTMSTQDADNVAITGGSITGMTILEATHALTADSATTATNADNATTADSATTAATATHATTADSATTATTATSASTATLADYATNANYATSAGSILNQGTAATMDAGVALGVATLDGAGTLSSSQIPASLIGAVEYQGAWNAETNDPPLTSSVGTKGYYFVVSVAGNTELDGISDWRVNDWAIFNGSVWQAVYNTNGVFSVNGMSGVVDLTNTDIPGFGTMSTQDADNVAITGGSITGITIAEATHAVSADSATTATTATTATSATHADTADSAGTATIADHATTADSATSATTALSADHATTADSATSATTATHATTADAATHADSADTATTAISATSAASATTANNADYATAAGTATSATTATTANALNAANSYEVDKLTATTEVQVGSTAGNHVAINDLGGLSVNGGGFSPMVTEYSIGNFAPSLTGTGATGTWGVDISGNAATATSATTAASATNADHATTADTATSATTATTATSATNADHATTADSATTAANGGVTSIIAGTNVTIDQSTGDVTINATSGSTPTYFYHECWVDVNNGSDSNNGHSPVSPFKTIGKALTSDGTNGNVINVASGIYNENITITNQNIDIIGMSDASGVVQLNGTVTFNNNVSSVRVANLGFHNVVTFSGSQGVYLTGCSMNGSYFTKANSGYVQALNCDFGSATGFAVSAGSYIHTGGNLTGLAVSGTGTALVKNALSVVAPSASAGTLAITDSIVYAISAGGNAVSANGTSIVSMSNAACYDSSLAVTKVSLTGLAYSLSSVIFLRASSTLSAACAGAITQSDVIGTAPYVVAALPSAATVGAGTRAFVTDAASPANFNTTVAGGGTIKVPVFSDGTSWKIG